MYIKIHRGQNQIGGSIVEIASEITKIILDTGAELDEEIPAVPQIDGLFTGKPAYDAVFLSHNHGDHLGLCDRVLPGIPIYIGRAAAMVVNAARRYLNRPEYPFTAYYESEKPIVIGDLRITPYLCDHSAFDAYMLHIACGEQTVLYSGDFRANGRKSFAHLLQRLPGADVLISEGTTLSRAAVLPQTEAELETLAAQEIAQTKGPVFVLQAATNLDRLVTVFRAARRSGRVLLQDLYLAEVASAAGGKIPDPVDFSGVRVFLTGGGDERYALLNGKYGNAKIGRAGIAKLPFVMCVRPSMQHYLEKLSQQLPFDGGILFYSLWSGYQAKPEMAAFLQWMQSCGVRIVELHTSGHGDAETIRALIDHVKPRYLIPIHTENAPWFASCKDCAVVYGRELAF